MTTGKPRSFAGAFGGTSGTLSSATTSVGGADGLTVGLASLRSRSPRPLVHGSEWLCGGPAAELALAGPAWHRVWAMEDCPVPAERRLRDCVRALPAFSPLATLTDDAVVGPCGG